MEIKKIINLILNDYKDMIDLDIVNGNNEFEENFYNLDYIDETINKFEKSENETINKIQKELILNLVQKKNDIIRFNNIKEKDLEEWKTLNK